MTREEAVEILTDTEEKQFGSAKEYLEYAEKKQTALDMALAALRREIDLFYEDETPIDKKNTMGTLSHLEINALLRELSRELEQERKEIEVKI